MGNKIRCECLLKYPLMKPETSKLYVLKSILPHRLIILHPPQNYLHSHSKHRPITQQTNNIIHIQCPFPTSIWINRQPRSLISIQPRPNPRSWSDIGNIAFDVGNDIWNVFPQIVARIKGSAINQLYVLYVKHTTKRHK